MKYLLPLFTRLILRPLGREPMRTSLTVMAVALGVAVVVAIDLAGDAAAGSFRSSLESLTGNSDLIIRGTGGLDENLLGKLVQLPYPLGFAPRIESFAFVRGRGAAIPFFGLDLIGQSLTGDKNGQFGPMGSVADLADNFVWAGRSTGLKPGDHVELLVNDVMHPAKIAGLLPSAKGIGEDRVLVADIGFAQKLTGREGRLDSIEVTIPNGESVDRWRDILRPHLPPSVDLTPAGSRTDENRKMLAAFRWNLHVLSYIALIVGGFLIYNTISISVVRRRSEIGVVRALGASKALIGGGFLAEALALASAGTAAGLMLGRVLALGAVQLIGTTVQSLYVSSVPARVQMSATALLTGICLGLGVSLLAAIAPAWEAAQIPPTEAMARGREQYLAAVRSRRTIWLALAMLLVGLALTQPGPVYGKSIFAYISVILLVGGTSLAVPNIWIALVARTQGVIANVLGVEAMLATRSLRASISRTSVLTAALATAVAMTASIGIMVGSFRDTVRVWMDNQLRADFYLRPAVPAGADRYPVMSAEVADAIEKLPGVAAVDRFRSYPISYEGLPANLAGSETSKLKGAGATRFLPGESSDAILAQLPRGDFAIVSEPFANKHNVRPGTELRLPIGNGIRTLKVLGIYYDYSTERGFVVVDRATLLKYLPDQALSNLAVYLDKDANSIDVRAAIDKIVSGRSVLGFSSAALRRAAIEIFDRTFRVTYALEVVAIFVAVMGIAGSLLAMVIDRRRELAIFRFLGADRRQIRTVILCEAGLLGVVANVVGLLLGTLLSLILIFVINKQSFGWTIQFHWPAGLLCAAVAGVFVATVLAGFYPAQKAIALNPIEAIHEE
ncbi:MAG: FtsX-like permease family protein [Bryobacteraceae bacterium]